MAELKGDLVGVENLLDDKPVDTNNLIETMEQRERQMDELQTILPKLAMFDTKRIASRSKSLSNDQLFKAFVTEFEQHNTDLNEFKEISTHEVKGKRDLKLKADELTRIALKQNQLDAIKVQINEIQRMQDDRQLQKALLGNLFLWYEKGNSNLIPTKYKPVKMPDPATLELTLPQMPKSVRNKTKGRYSLMNLPKSLKHQAQQSE